MRSAALEKLGEKLAFPVERDGQDAARSSYERFAIPYSFKPRLSLSEAVVAAFGAFFRIVLGSILFGVWGTYTLVAWSLHHNFFWHAAVVIVMVPLFCIALALLMMAITALVRAVWPHRRAHS